VTADVVRLQGAPNFRDLGGLETIDGARVRCGLLFRSSGLEELTALDVAQLVDVIGIRTVIDLRTADDRDAASPLDATGVRVVNLPIRQEAHALSTSRPMTADGWTDVPLVLRQFMEMSVESIRTLVTELADGAMPAVFHCAAGKDRTGVVAAILLEAIGVTRAAIIDDFAASEATLDATIEYLMRRPAYREVIPALPPGTMLARPQYMADFLDDVDRRHGGIAGWLTATAGVSPTSLARLRAALVEP
jgi:protein tyrosine/serine phosphatase